MGKTAVLVDGNYYIRRARKLFGDASPDERAQELYEYVLSHISVGKSKRVELGPRDLYRIFYYDCPPVQGINVLQPWDGRNHSLSVKRGDGKWRADLLSSLGKMRKVALRLGEVSYRHARYVPNEAAMKELRDGVRDYTQLEAGDYELIGIKQTGVDMRIGLDVASMANGGIVDQIILIAGDSDFIPVSKAARRAGVDFIIDPMGGHIHDDLYVETDGIEDLSSAFASSRRVSQEDKE